MQKDVLQQYVKSVESKGDFIFEHYLVVYEDLDGIIKYRRIETSEPANSFAFYNKGEYYHVYQDQKGNIFLDKCSIHNSKDAGIYVKGKFKTR